MLAGFKLKFFFFIHTGIIHTEFSSEDFQASWSIEFTQWSHNITYQYIFSYGTTFTIMINWWMEVRSVSHLFPKRHHLNYTCCSLAVQTTITGLLWYRRKVWGKFLRSSWAFLKIISKYIYGLVTTSDIEDTNVLRHMIQIHLIMCDLCLLWSDLTKLWQNCFIVFIRGPIPQEKLVV